MWLIVISGTILTYSRYGFFKYRWLNLIQLLMAAIVLDAHLVIVPTADKALELAKLSLADGILRPDYHSAYLRESIFGAFNVFSIIISMVAGIWKFKKRARPNI